jgi:hypothetical protein
VAGEAATREGWTEELKRDNSDGFLLEEMFAREEYNQFSPGAKQLKVKSQKAGDASSSYRARKHPSL